MTRLAILGCLLLTVCGCSKREAQPITESASAYPRRLVSMAPGITEILLRLGADAMLVGTSSDCPVPKGHDPARLGNLVLPDIEQLVLLNPDLVLTVHEPSFERQLLARKIPFEVVELDSFTKLITAYERVGRLLGLQDQAREQERKLVDQIGRLKRQLKGVARPRVLLVLGPHPRWVGGSASMFNDMIRFAQGMNVATLKGGRLYELSPAEVRLAAPEVIIEVVDMSRDRAGVIARERLFWRRFKGVPAVANNRIVFLDERLFLMVGPKSIAGTQQLARALHPDRFQ